MQLRDSQGRWLPKNYQPPFVMDTSQKVDVKLFDFFGFRFSEKEIKESGLKWRTSNSKVASIQETGPGMATVLAHKPGVAYIRFGVLSAKIRVTL